MMMKPMAADRVREDLAAPRDVAIVQLHTEHCRELVRLAGILLGNRETAEEVVQDAFAKVYEVWDRVRDPTRRASYLRSVTLNGARKRLRRRRVAARLMPMRPRDPRVPEDAALASEREHHLIAELGRLPHRQRECLVLRFFLDLDEAETAEVLGISRGSVKTHAHRGLRTLGSRLEEHR